jgi:hypothetical protein
LFHLDRVPFSCGSASDAPQLCCAVALPPFHYCKVTRSAGSATVSLQIYAKAARTTILSTQTITTFSASVKWRFIYALRGILDDEALAMATFYLENLQVVSYS